MSSIALTGQNPDGVWQVRTVFQPVVDLATGIVMGAEAFSRDTAGNRPIVELIEQARFEHTLDDLDRACQRSAIDAWLQARMHGPLALFLNVEPSSLGADIDADIEAHFDQLQASGTRVVVEITERDLLRNPRALFRFRDRVRERGWDLAIDDIGVDAQSAAMLPLLAPEVLKLDMQIMQRAPGRHTAHTISAVLAQAERTGATVLAEGIETQAHLDLAQSAGATLGQGWLFGKPTPQLPPTVDCLTPTAPRSASPEVGPGLWTGSRIRRPITPWQLVQHRPQIRQATKPLLIAMSTHIERQVVAAEPATVLIGAFQDAAYLPQDVLMRYAQHAKTAAFVGIIGAGTQPEPGPGIRGHNLRPGDPMLTEWTVVVLSPYLSVALVANDTTPLIADTTEADRRFDYLLIHDRELTTQIARLLMARFTLKD